MSESSPRRAPRRLDPIEPPVGRVVIPPAYRRAGIPADEGSSSDGPSDGPSASSTSTVETLFSSMETSYELGPRWVDSKNQWAKRLLPAQKGRIGERFFKEICAEAGVETTPRTGSGHDIRCHGTPVEVKFGTLHDNTTDSPDRVEWLQLRPNGDFTHVALICTCPDHHHVWVVPRQEVFKHTVGQHGGKSAKETMVLAIDPHKPPQWLGTDIATDLGVLSTVLPAPAE